MSDLLQTAECPNCGERSLTLALHQACPSCMGRDETGVVRLIQDLLTQGAQCPLCGSSQPHDHTGLEVLCYRNGIKWARASQVENAALLQAVLAWEAADEGDIGTRQQARIALHDAVDSWRSALSTQEECDGSTTCPLHALPAECENCGKTMAEHDALARCWPERSAVESSAARDASTSGQRAHHLYER